MVRKLLVPVDEGLNEHKRQQLQELAALNGTVREGDNVCRLCGEPGHKQYACPERNNQGFRADVSCKICGDGGHPTVDCPMKGSAGATGEGGGMKMDEEYASFLAEVGATGVGAAGGKAGAGASGGGPGALRLPGPSGEGGGGEGMEGGQGGPRRGPGPPQRDDDECNLYVGYLPNSVDDDALFSLFSSFGRITQNKVIKDRATGMSRGFGFVRFADKQAAAAAVAAMHGYRIENKALVVRSTVKNQQQGPPHPSSGPNTPSGPPPAGMPFPPAGGPPPGAPPGAQFPYPPGGPPPYGMPIPPVGAAGGMYPGGYGPEGMDPWAGAYGGMPPPYGGPGYDPSAAGYMGAPGMEGAGEDEPPPGVAASQDPLPPGAAADDADLPPGASPPPPGVPADDMPGSAHPGMPFANGMHAAPPPGYPPMMGYPPLPDPAAAAALAVPLPVPEAVPAAPPAGFTLPEGIPEDHPWAIAAKAMAGNPAAAPSPVLGPTAVAAPPAADHQTGGAGNGAMMTDGEANMMSGMVAEAAETGKIGSD